MILAGDVGGTKTVLGLFRRRGDRLEPVRERTFASQDHRSFDAIVDAFLGPGTPRVAGAAVGVAGPVVAGRSRLVNLRWSVDARRLARRLGLGEAHVINDLEANAWGIPRLPRGRLRSLTPGLRGGTGNAALIAAGTGLGMALLVWDGERHHPSASEGGHQSFAPRDAREIALLRFLARRHGRVSVERVLSGPGLAAIYDFLATRGGGSSALRARLGRASDPSAEIGAAGLDGSDRLAREALELFVSIYGATAGDLALVARAAAGVYLGGGIAPKILPALLGSSTFLAAFRSKGRLSPLLEAIPVRVILEPRTALIGAAACAAHRTAARIAESKGRRA